MPGRPKSRPSEREPRVSAKGVAQSSQVSGAEHDSPTQLRTQFCRIFGDAQINLAGHRKLVVSLRKVQESCIRDDDGGKARKSQDLLQFAEEDFNAEFARCVIRLMTVKKGEGIGDKLVRFIGLFLKNASEKGLSRYWGPNNPGILNFYRYSAFGRRDWGRCSGHCHGDTYIAISEPSILFVDHVSVSSRKDSPLPSDPIDFSHHQFA